jgi:transposase
MGRYKEAPWGYECPYKDNCPHLGMSVTWALLEIRDARKQGWSQGLRLYETEEYVNALQERNRQLEKENADLKALLTHQHRLKFKANKKPPETPPGKTPPKRGAPFGHPGWQRPVPERMDQSVPVDAPTVCPHCRHEGLEPTGHLHTQIQEDIVLQPRTIVTEYVHQTAYCPTCRREVFQTAPDELRNCSIGPVTKAMAVYLRHEFNLSYRNVEKLFSSLFGMPFVPASAMAFSDSCATSGAELYADLQRKVRVAQIIHGDETHWRIDGKSAQLWYAGNPEFDFFHADFSRGSDVAAQIFGESFGGHLVADSYAAYNIINPEARQTCLAHLLRKAKEISERIRLLPGEKQDPPSIHFCASLSDLLRDCCALGQQRNRGVLPFQKARDRIPELKKMRDEICRDPLCDEEAENLRKRISDPNRDGERLFVFLDVNGMEPTNNHAEQALRHPVIFRKICFGNRSLEGAQHLAVNLSILGTAKRQDQDPVDLIKTILLKGAGTPLEKLYRPENMPVPDSS